MSNTMFILETKNKDGVAIHHIYVIPLAISEKAGLRKVIEAINEGADSINVLLEKDYEKIYTPSMVMHEYLAYIDVPDIFRSYNPDAKFRKDIAEECAWNEDYFNWLSDEFTGAMIDGSGKEALLLKEFNEICDNSVRILSEEQKRITTVWELWKVQHPEMVKPNSTINKKYESFLSTTEKETALQAYVNKGNNGVVDEDDDEYV